MDTEPGSVTDPSASGGAADQDRPPPKRSKKATGAESAEQTGEPAGASSLPVQFVTLDGSPVGPRLDLPLAASQEQMERLVNQLGTLDSAGAAAAEPPEEAVPYAFYVNGNEVTSSLAETVKEMGLSTESQLTITCQPLAVFRVRPVTRCSETMPGHSDAVLHVSYSPDGSRLASGGGDTTVRFWDVLTATPKHTCRGHRHHVLCTAWSPDGKRFASADFTGEVSG